MYKKEKARFIAFMDLLCTIMFFQAKYFQYAKKNRSWPVVLSIGRPIAGILSLYAQIKTLECQLLQRRSFAAQIKTLECQLLQRRSFAAQIKTLECQLLQRRSFAPQAALESAIRMSRNKPRISKNSATYRIRSAT